MRPCAFFVLVAILGANANLARAQTEIITDRPDLSYATVPQGSLQVETGASWTHLRNDETFDGPETVIRFGLTPSGELRLGLPNYFHSGDHRFGNGFSDILLGWKQQFPASPAGFQLSIGPGVTLPSGSAGRTNKVSVPQFDLAWLRPVDSRWSISGVQVLDYSAANSRHVLEALTVLGVERGLGQRKDAYLEYQRFDSPLGSSEMLEAGVAYRNRPSCQFDVLVGVGYGRGGAEFTLGVGFSFRQDNIWKR